MSGIMAMLMNNVAPRGDRTVFPFSRNVLIVYDLNSVRPGIYNSPNPHPSTLAANISARETALGFTPTTITSYSSFVSTDISRYAHIWDVGYDTLITTAAAAKYKTYLQGGGAMFLLGENGLFVDRDTSLDNFIEVDMGGGSSSISGVNLNAVIPSIVASEFLLSNNDNTVTLNNPGVWTSIGNGTTLVSSGSGIHGAVWKTGSLSQAPTSAICSVLDVNFLSTDFDSNFVDNVSIVLNKI
jgi:hypothetical protein